MLRITPNHLNAARVAGTLVLACALAAFAPYAGAVTVAPSPADTSVTVGDVFTVCVGVDAIADLRGFELVYAFDPAHFELVGAAPGDVITRSGDPYFASTVDDDAMPRDSVWFDAAMLGTTTSGPGTLATFTFRAIALGDGTIDGRTVDLRQPDNTPIVVPGGTSLVHVRPPDVQPPAVHVLAPNGGENFMVGTHATLSWTADDEWAPIATVALRVSRDLGATWETLDPAAPNTGTYDWIVSMPGTNVDANPVFTALLEVVAHDAAGHAGADASDAGFSIFDFATPTVLTRLDAAPRAGAIVVRWSLSQAAAFARVVVERSAYAPGPWQAIDAPVVVEGDAHAAVDHDVRPGVDYWYRLVGVSHAGAVVALGTVHAVAAAPAGAMEIVSANPTRGSLRVVFAVPDARPVRLAVLDVQGREVAVLASGALAPGRYEAAWDGVGRTGRVPAGLYFARLDAGGRAEVRRVSIAR